MGTIKENRQGAEQSYILQLQGILKTDGLMATGKTLTDLWSRNGNMTFHHSANIYNEDSFVAVQLNEEEQKLSEFVTEGLGEAGILSLLSPRGRFSRKRSLPRKK